MVDRRLDVAPGLPADAPADVLASASSPRTNHAPSAHTEIAASTGAGWSILPAVCDDGAGTCILDVRADGTIRGVLGAPAALLGATLLEGATLADAFTAELAERLARAITNAAFDGQPRREDGLSRAGRHVAVTLLPCTAGTAALVVRDLTIVQAILHQLERAGPKATVGAATIDAAHEINNVHAAMVVLLDSATYLGVDPTVIRANVQRLQIEATRTVGLMHRLTLLAPRAVGPTADDAAFPLDGLVQDVLQSLSTLLKAERITVSLTNAAPGETVIGHAGAVTVVLNTLILNALDAVRALPHGTRREIAIELQQDTDQVAVTIRDSGVGISEDVAARLFAVPISTKHEVPGAGTSLLVGAIMMRRMNGSLALVSARSAAGAGAAFRLTVPRFTPIWTTARSASVLTLTAGVTIEERESAERLAHPQQAMQRLTDRQARRVLIVDDEINLRYGTRQVLEHYGTEVVEAANGRAALDLLREAPDYFACILLDRRLPGMDGTVVYREIAAVAPAMVRRVIFMSGEQLGLNVEFTRFLEQHRLPYLKKPCTPQALLEALDGVCRVADRQAQRGDTLAECAAVGRLPEPHGADRLPSGRAST